MNIETLVKKTVLTTVNELKKRKIINSYSLDYYMQTEKLLRMYNDMKTSEQFTNQKSQLVKIIDEALNMISSDPYVRIIHLHYFENKSLREVSEMIHIDHSNVCKHKKRLVQRLTVIIFGDESVIDLLKG